MLAANDKLQETSEIDGTPEPTMPKPAKQPPLRKPLPASLERVANLIPVAPEKRPCPLCGKALMCIGHDVTQVAELRLAVGEHLSVGVDHLDSARRPLLQPPAQAAAASVPAATMPKPRTRSGRIAPQSAPRPHS